MSATLSFSAKPGAAALRLLAKISVPALADDSASVAASGTSLGIGMWLLLGLGLLGHVAFWIALINRLHGTGIPRWLSKSITAVLHAWIMLFSLGIAWLVWRAPLDALSGVRLTASPIVGYLALCALFALYHYPNWFWRRARQTRNPALVDHVTRVIDMTGSVPPLISGWRAKAFSYVPGNELLHLHVEEKTLAIENLAPELAGISIAHISDLHFSGRVTRSYFDALVNLVNDFDVDLIALTGDVCDKTECLDWIEPTLGRMRSRLGAFFVLGNHDLRVDDVPQLRRTLTRAGFNDVSQAAQELRAGRQSIFVAGNEHPWFRRSSQPPSLLSSMSPDQHEGLRILLSHSPDQFAWAQSRQFDLMLAGHTHGGQIRLPLIGPIVCPSKYGVTYSDGVFTGGGAVMHVSRGTCSLMPLRWGCPPELTKLVLVPGQR